MRAWLMALFLMATMGALGSGTGAVDAGPDAATDAGSHD